MDRRTDIPTFMPSYQLSFPGIKLFLQLKCHSVFVGLMFAMNVLLCNFVENIPLINFIKPLSLMFKSYNLFSRTFDMDYCNSYHISWSWRNTEKNKRIWTSILLLLITPWEKKQMRIHMDKKNYENWGQVFLLYFKLTKSLS